MKKLEFREEKVMPFYEEIPNTVKEVLKYMISFLCGLLFGSLSNFGAMAPFGVALVAASPLKYILSTGLGSAAGYILTQDSVTSLRYIAALISTGVLIRLAAEFEKTKNIKLMPSYISAFTCISTSFAMLFASSVNAESFFMYIAEALIAFASTYFICTSIEVVKNQKTLKGLSNKEIGAVTIVMFFVLLSLSDIAVFNISFARIMAAYIVMLISYIYKESGGAVTGITATLAFLMSKDVGILSIGYAVAGLLSGIFAHSKRIFSAGVFVSAFSVAFLFAGGEQDKLYLIIEAAISAIFFVATPTDLIRKLENRILPENNDCEKIQRQAVLSRLKSSSKAIEEVGNSVSNAFQILEKKYVPDTNSVYARVQDSVCAKCGLFDFCWNKNFKDTLKAFDEMSEKLKQNEIISASNAPTFFANRCLRLSSIAKSFNKTYAMHIANLSAESKINEMRMITADQFSGICDMLSDVADEFESGITFDNVRAERIRDLLFNELSLVTSTVSCIVDENDRLRVEVSFDNLPKSIKLQKIRQTISNAVSRNLEIPVLSKGDNCQTLFLCEKTQYLIEMSASQITANGDSFCGDSFESFYDGRGNYIIILSDGMGTGERAAIDSSMTCGIMSRLIKSGFHLESAVKLVNSALLLKSKDESLSTLDMLKINLYNGNATFYKCSAAPSLIKRKNKLLEIKKSSMPLGILRDVGFAKSEGKLIADDTILMASDGAFDFSESAVRNELKKVNNEDTQVASKKIAMAAKNFRQSKRCDDISIILIRLKENKS
ncbi:MAG: SpoIIE family protein phosphatase [Oscillospiraceae bacterium]